MKNNATLLMTLLFSLLCMFPLQAGQYFALCEGNIGQANATLWSIDESLTNIEGPLVWNTSTNPMGDIGQSLTLFDHTLYIVMNNSHQIRMVQLDPTPIHSGDIELPGSSPRYFAAHRESGKGYVSCWNLAALLVIDMAQNTIVDTIPLNAMPEEIIIDGDDMYVSIALQAGTWVAENEVWHFDLGLAEPTVVDRYVVIDGPGSMSLIGDKLYVTSIYYNDAWESFSGSSVIDLMDHSVSTVDHGLYANFSADIRAIGTTPYRTYGDFILPLNPDLSLNASAGIGNLSGIYSFSVMNSTVFIGTSDFVAPDEINAFSASGQALATFNVGALPGDFVYYDADLVSSDESMSQPQQFQLAQNYPNPFNPTTVIPFVLSENGFVTLQIYDLQGKLVSTIAAEDYPAGPHQLIWDGRNTAGESMASGLYHALLTSAGGSSLVKMTLLR